MHLSGNNIIIYMWNKICIHVVKIFPQFDFHGKETQRHHQYRKHRTSCWIVISRKSKILIFHHTTSTNIKNATSDTNLVSLTRRGSQIQVWDPGSQKFAHINGVVTNAFVYPTFAHHRSVFRVLQMAIRIKKNPLFSSEYILFYERKMTACGFKIPSLPKWKRIINKAAYSKIIFTGIAKCKNV